MRFASLPNLLLDAPVLPEALFDACSPERVAEMLRYRPCLGLGSLCMHRIAEGRASDEAMRHIGRIVTYCSASRSKLHCHRYCHSLRTVGQNLEDALHADSPPLLSCSDLLLRGDQRRAQKAAAVAVMRLLAPPRGSEGQLRRPSEVAAGIIFDELAKRLV